MMAISADEFRTVLARGSLREAEAHRGVGRELSFADGPVRTVVVHFGEHDSERYRCDVTDRILALQEEWLLVPRNVTVASLRILEVEAGTAAIRFESSERASLSKYLCTRPVSLAEGFADLYAVSATGSVVLTWDHHTEEDGLEIQFRHISDAGRLLGTLNELGAELDLFYLDQESAGRK